MVEITPHQSFARRATLGQRRRIISASRPTAPSASSDRHRGTRLGAVRHLRGVLRFTLRRLLAPRRPYWYGGESPRTGLRGRLCRAPEQPPLHITAVRERTRIHDEAQLLMHCWPMRTSSESSAKRASPPCISISRDARTNVEPQFPAPAESPT